MKEWEQLSYYSNCNLLGTLHLLIINSYMWNDFS